MAEPLPPRHSARETRLLLLTLAVSVAALLLLARFRFPERPLTDLSPPQPLSRLTRVTAFDELSAMLRDLLRQFEGAVVLAHTPGVALGLLVKDDLALVPVPAGGRVEAVAGSPLAANGVVARDEQRGLVVVRVPGYTAPEISVQPAATPIDAPGYVAILEAAPDGPTIRAEFVSRYSTEFHAGWDQPVLALSGPAGATAKPGSLVFTLGGRFVGMTLADSGRLLVVPANVLMPRAARLAGGESVVAVASGISVQALTPVIARATGVTEGVVVSGVSGTAESTVSAPAGDAGAGGGAGEAATDGSKPSRGNAPGPRNGAAHIIVGDVITSAANRPVRAPRDWQQILRAQAAGATIKLSIVRFSKPLEATLTLPRAVASTSPSSTSGASPSRGTGGDANTSGAPGASAPSPLEVMGLSLRGASGDSEVLAVRAASPAARAGLRVGDLITSLPGRSGAPGTTTWASPNAVANAFAELASGQALMLALDRDGASLIVAIEKP